MKINEAIYPYNIEARKLPVHLTGIGGTEWQEHIIRPDGYHWHQILFSEEGEGVLKYDNAAVRIEEGEFFFLPTGYPHEYFSNNEKWGVKWITFDGYAVNHILSLMNMTKPTVIKPYEPEALQSLFAKMYAAQRSDKLHCDFICSGLVYEFIIEFNRHMNDRESRLRSDRSKLIIPVLNYIDENFRQDFSLTVLAGIAGVSPQHLCRVFKEAMNMRPGEYLTEKRLRESRRLLRTSGLPIAKIAILSGFSDPGYFGTVFKKHEGITPAEYKKIYSGKQ